MKRITLAGALCVLIPALAFAQQSPAPVNPIVDATGTVTGTLTVPLSQFISDEARSALIERMKRPPSFSLKDGVEAVRKASSDAAKVRLDKWLSLRPAIIESQTIDGVRVDIVTPKDGVAPENANRILINGHSGGFFTGSPYGGALEAVPLATAGKVKVIAVDYRMSPEVVFPAASEDMEKVYREVLKTTKPENVGIYGCSAGGTLAAQTVAWLRSKGLPRPGAIGIFCAGALDTFWYGGDAGAVTPFMSGQPPATPGQRPPGAPRDYFDGIDTHDPLITPAEFPEELRYFPPTLVVSGTRDIAMGNAIMTHTKLLAAGVRAELFIQEGLGHGDFAFLPGTPEADLAHDVIWDFFDRQLGR